MKVGCYEHLNMTILSQYPEVTYGSGGGRGGGGCQSGIGGVKSKPVLLEFLVAVNVKKCTILGVKRVVPLVYRGGGCNSYTRIWGHFEPFWGRFWGLIKDVYFDTITQ